MDPVFINQNVSALPFNAVCHKAVKNRLMAIKSHNINLRIYIKITNIIKYHAENMSERFPGYVPFQTAGKNVYILTFHGGGEPSLHIELVHQGEGRLQLSS